MCSLPFTRVLSVPDSNTPVQYGGGGGGGGDRVPSCRHRAGGVGQFLAGMQFSTKVLKCVVIW